MTTKNTIAIAPITIHLRPDRRAGAGSDDIAAGTDEIADGGASVDVDVDADGRQSPFDGFSAMVPSPGPRPRS
jgi:hypothetical protein